MELKKTALQNLKDILADADSQAHVAIKEAERARAREVRSETADKDHRITAQNSPQPVEKSGENVDKSVIVLKINELELSSNAHLDRQRLYDLLRSLWDR